MVLAVIFTILFFGVKVFNEDIIDINVHDTYYVFSPLHFITALSIVFLLMIYIARIFHRFFRNNKIANYLFVAVQVIIVLLFSNLMIFNHAYASSDFNFQTGELNNSYPITNQSNMTIIQLLLIIFLIYSLIKMDRKFRNIGKT